MSSKDTDEQHVMYSKSDNREITIKDKVDEVIEEPFQLLLPRYPIGLERSTKRSDFIFDCGQILYYKCYKINPNRGGLYIDSREQNWKISKKNIKN